MGDIALARGQSSLLGHLRQLQYQPVLRQVLLEVVWCAQSGESYPALRVGAASYHPGLDYCLICWYKSDVSTIETILYEYSLNQPIISAAF